MGPGRARVPLATALRRVGLAAWVQGKRLPVSLCLLHCREGESATESEALETGTREWVVPQVFVFFRGFAIFPLPKWYLVGVEISALADLTPQFAL